MTDRYLVPHILKDLPRKMIFLGGPRQVGKTTLAKSLLKNESGYLNWDVSEHREKILKKKLPVSSLWVFDELHKYRSWRNYLKGLFDVREKQQRILVTGSARLDYYRYGGDSLQGRYHFFRLHPLSVAELGLKTQKEFSGLLKLGGFPEPYFGGSDIDAKRWSREYRTRLIQDDFLSVEQIKDVGNLELLMLRLPDLVGSPLSINALREDLQVNHKTVSSWLDGLERMYALFRISPFGSPKIRAVKKEQKHYHYDWTLVKEPSLRFENCVGCHLMKWVHFQQDVFGRDLELRYFRDVDKREVDFVVVEDGSPILAVECKWNDTHIHPALRYFKTRFPECRTLQVLATATQPFKSAEGIPVLAAVEFLQELA